MSNLIPHIAIISSSIRRGRNSHRVALYLQRYITKQSIASVEILDLHKYNFPIFDERLKFQEHPSQMTAEFAEHFRKAHGIIIVTPEYNGGYPAALKNVIDLLVEEWKHKPTAIATCSSGDFGGSQVITSLQFSLWKLQATIATATFPSPKVQEIFDENGIAADPLKTDKRAMNFTTELLRCITQNNIETKS